MEIDEDIFDNLEINFDNKEENQEKNSLLNIMKERRIVMITKQQYVS